MANHTIEIGGFELSVHDFEPYVDFPDMCIICNTHRHDLPHWTAG